MLCVSYDTPRMQRSIHSPETFKTRAHLWRISVSTPLLWRDQFFLCSEQPRNFTLKFGGSSCVCYGCEMSRGGPLSPCPICHSLSALHLPQNLEEERASLRTWSRFWELLPEKFLKMQPPILGCFRDCTFSNLKTVQFEYFLNVTILRGRDRP